MLESVIVKVNLKTRNIKTTKKTVRRSK